MAKRKPLSKKIRFEVLKRDSFKCSYCGAAAPDTILHVDHVVPVSKGGTNDVVNLVSSCRSCNLGKSDIELSDSSAISRQRTQLEELQEKKEQIEFMIQWQKELSDATDNAGDELVELFNERARGRTLHEGASQGLKALARKFGVREVMEAINYSTNEHLVFNRDGDATEESVNDAYHAIEKRCALKKWAEKNPVDAKMKYILGIMRNRYYSLNHEYALNILHDLYDEGIPLERLENLAKRTRNINQFQEMAEVDL